MNDTKYQAPCHEDELWAIKYRRRADAIRFAEEGNVIDFTLSNTAYDAIKRSALCRSGMHWSNFYTFHIGKITPELVEECLEEYRTQGNISYLKTKLESLLEESTGSSAGTTNRDSQSSQEEQESAIHVAINLISDLSDSELETVAQIYCAALGTRKQGMEYLSDLKSKLVELTLTKHNAYSRVFSSPSEVFSILCAAWSKRLMRSLKSGTADGEESSI